MITPCVLLSSSSHENPPSNKTGSSAGTTVYIKVNHYDQYRQNVLWLSRYAL